MSGNEDETREEGIEFGELYNDIENEDYPISQSELIERYGDRELEHSNGTYTLRELLSQYPEDQEFEDDDEVRQSILNMAGGEAVGRQRYSDRGEDPDSNQESF